MYPISTPRMCTLLGSLSFSYILCRLEGKINERFSYTHKPELHCRNYACTVFIYFLLLHLLILIIDVVTHVEGAQPIIDAKLILGHPITH